MPLHRERKICPKFLQTESFLHGRPRAMSVPRCLFSQDLEGLTEVFSRMPAGMSAPKLPLWANFGGHLKPVSHIKASHPHFPRFPRFPHFPRFRVRIFRVFARWNLLRPLFLWCGVRGTFRIFPIFPVSGSNR